MSGDPGTEAGALTPPASEAPPAVKTSRLLATLGLGGAIAGILLVIVYGLTLPAIEENKRQALEAAIKEVLKGSQRYETFYVVNGALAARVPEGADAKKLQRVYLGYGDDRRPVGFAIVAAEPGFQDIVSLIFGYDAATKQLLGMRVLESKETPGLGNKIEKDQAFLDQFGGAQPPLVGVKSGKRSKPSEVETITGATISSKTVIRIINNALQRLGPLVDAYPQEGRG